MKLTAKELETIVMNCELNSYMRDMIGTALCKKIYDPANSEDDYPGDYIKLYDGAFYNCPDDDDIMLCIEYIEEGEDSAIEINFV